MALNSQPHDYLAAAWQIHNRQHSHDESDQVDALLRQAIGYERPSFDYLVDEPFGPSAASERRMDPEVLRSQHLALNASISRLLSHSWARAVVHSGDIAPLRHHLQRCTAGHPFTVVALGCSMTEGRMACFGKGTGACMDNGCPRLRWCGKVQRWLSRLLPCRVSVACARRGSGSATYAYGFEALVARHKPALVLSNIAHCDTTLTPVSDAYEKVKAASEYVIRRTLALPAAYVHMQPAAPLRSPDAAALCADEATQPQRAWPLELARHYALPALSFTRAACAADPLLGPLRHWDGGCSATAALCEPRNVSWPGVKCFIHPGAHTHHLYSLLFVERVLSAARDAAATSATTATAAAAAAAAATATAAAAAEAVSVASAAKPGPEVEGLPTFYRAEEVERFGICAGGGDRHDFSAACEQPASDGDGGWRCFEDVPGRKGWVGFSNSSAPLSWSLPLRGATGNGTVIVTYVRSYEGFGVARAWLDDDEARGVELDGRWASRTSQPFLHVLPIRRLCGESCEAKSSTLVKYPRALRGAHLHLLHILPPASSTRRGAELLKFKLVGLYVC